MGRDFLESPETETRASVGFGAGVRDHRFTDWTQEYGPKETSISETGSFLDLIPFSHEGILSPIIIGYSLFFNRGEPLLFLFSEGLELWLAPGVIDQVIDGKLATLSPRKKS